MKIGVFFAEGFETIEALTVVDYLRRAGIDVDMISADDKEYVKSAQDVVVKTEIILKSIENIDDYYGFVIPGGMGGATSLSKNDKVLEIIRSCDKKSKLVCAICAGPMVLVESGILDGRKITGYPGMFEDGEGYTFLDEKVVVDGNIITSRGPSLTVYFALEIIEKVSGIEKRKKLEKDILIDIMER